MWSKTYKNSILSKHLLDFEWLTLGERDLKKKLKLQIQKEVDEVVRECMEWELKVLYSTCRHYRIAKAIHAEYYMSTIAFPLLKQEVQLMKNKFLSSDCHTNELGVYAQVPIQDYQVAQI